jgi:hypothetical protein
MQIAFEQWTQAFPDAMAAPVVTDRIFHNGAAFELSGGKPSARSTNRKLEAIASSMLPSAVDAG